MTSSSHIESTLELLKTLVAFDTTSRESNLSLIEFVRDHLSALGIASRLSYDAQRKKANLFATIGDMVRRGTRIHSKHTSPTEKFLAGVRST